MKRLKMILGEKRELIDQGCYELATNFYTPAKQIVGFYAAQLGITVKEWDKLTELRAHTIHEYGRNFTAKQAEA
jgi:hypothetical protein